MLRYSRESDILSDCTSTIRITRNKTTCLFLELDLLDVTSQDETHTELKHSFTTVQYNMTYRNHENISLYPHCVSVIC